MGQATAIDLPEAAPNSSAPTSSADDLLSQLAGQEIDRLLADADEKGDAPSPVAVAQQAAASAKKVVPTDHDAEQIEAVLAPAKLAAEAETEEAKPQPFKKEYAAQVGELFKQLNTAPAPAPVVEPAPAPPAVVEQPTTTAERAAFAPVEPAKTETVQHVLEKASVDRVPLLVRLLELLNSPFNFCSDELRETLGKVAILTMMNSLGVLLYVMLFRHR